MDNYWKLWYFEFKPWVVPSWLGVKIVTPSSHNALPLIAKDNFERYQEANLRLLEMAQQDQTWQKTKEILETIDILEVKDWMQDVYWFENKLKSLTNKDKIKQKNLELRKQLLKIAEQTQQQPLDPNTQSNGQIPAEAMTNKAPKTPKFKKSEWVSNPATQWWSWWAEAIMWQMQWL
jgi:hypothetical protein